MKLLNNYISEKLIINKNIKAGKSLNEMTKEIISWLGLSHLKTFKDAEYPQWQLIHDWLEKNNVTYNDLQPCADQDTLNEYLMDQEEKKKYNDSPYINELCQEELSKSNRIYSSNPDNIEIRATEKMICNIGPFGTLYVILKSKLK